MTDQPTATPAPRDATMTGHCRRADHEACGFVLRAATGWNWWCTCRCHPEPTVFDAAADSGADNAIQFWRAHREDA